MRKSIKPVITLRDIGPMKEEEKKFKKGQIVMPYVKIRDRMIGEILNMTQTVWRKDKAILNGVSDLTSDLMMVDPKEGSIFVQDMWGFMQWATAHKEDARAALTTIIHDLGEFSRNRKENWFCPRTSGYRKYLSGASNEITW